MSGFSITFLVIIAISVIVSIVVEINIMTGIFLLGFPLIAVALVFWAVYYQVKSRKLGIHAYEQKKVWTEKELQEHWEMKKSNWRLIDTNWGLTDIDKHYY